jgi:hypothetical protein
MKAKSRRAAVAGLGVATAAGVLVALWVLSGGGSAGAQPAWSADPARSNSGEIMFTLTPRDVSGGRFRVDIQVNTHSGDLSRLDLQSATELHVAGQTLRPVKAPGLRGHHARGRLEFAMERVPDAFEIVIRGVQAMGDLTFRWP